MGFCAGLRLGLVFWVYDGYYFVGLRLRVGGVWGYELLAGAGVSSRYVSDVFWRLGFVGVYIFENIVSSESKMY